MRNPLFLFCSLLATFSIATIPVASAATSKPRTAHVKATTKTKVVVQKNRKGVAVRAIASARRDVHIARTIARPSTLEHPGVRSTGVLVINQLNGEVIYEKNADTVTPMASITKLMTAMVVLDAKLPLNEIITISTEDIDNIKGTGSRLSPGTALTRGEMLLLALMSSENRAASALSRHYPGGHDAFIRNMNAKAISLGMARSRFYDPTGLNPNNVSTPRELVLMVQAARAYPEIHQFSTSSEYSLTSNRSGRTLTFHNTNPLVRNDDWEIGLSKTGYINEAGHCLVMQAKISDTPVVIVLMDSNGKVSRIDDAQHVRKWMETSPVAKLRAG